MLVKDEELRLRELFEDGEPVSKIAAELSKTENAVGHKLWRLGLKEGMAQKRFVPSSSTEVELPAVMLSEYGVDLLVVFSLFYVSSSFVFVSAWAVL